MFIIPKKSCKEWVDVFTIDLRKERLCGIEKMKNADFFIQRTYYKEPPKLVDSFSKVKYACGYGIIIKKDRKGIIDVLNNTDWENYCNLATHNCKHINIYHIYKTLIDSGYEDNM